MLAAASPAAAEAARQKRASPFRAKAIGHSSGTNSPELQRPEIVRNASSDALGTLYTPQNRHGKYFLLAAGGGEQSAHFRSQHARPVLDRQLTGPAAPSRNCAGDTLQQEKSSLVETGSPVKLRPGSIVIEEAKERNRHCSGLSSPQASILDNEQLRLVEKQQEQRERPPMHEMPKFLPVLKARK